MFLFEDLFSNKVSDRLVCDIAAGFWEEFASANAELRLPSSSVLRKMYKKRKTKHENKTSDILKESGLSCPLPIDYVDLGSGKKHEIFRVEALLRALSLHDKLPLLIGHVGNLSLVDEYWKRVKVVNPRHPIFAVHAGREKYVIPCFLHCDEGRTLKKSAIMVCNIQPVLGGNRQPEYDPKEMHTNMKFISFCTRLLLFVMTKKTYKKSWDPFYKVLSSFATELLHLWEHGVELTFGTRKLTLYISLEGVKGDWPVLAKVGMLERWFGRKTRGGNDPKGICHLCAAGTANVPYHDFTANAAWRATYLRDNPFKCEDTPFSCLPCHGALFFRFDIFYCAHKGILAELAGSGLVPHTQFQSQVWV